MCIKKNRKFKGMKKCRRQRVNEDAVRVCVCVSPCPAAGCCWFGLPTGLLAYSDRMESLDRSFFCSVLVAVEAEVEERVQASACGDAVLEPDCQRRITINALKCAQLCSSCRIMPPPAVTFSVHERNSARLDRRR